MPIIKLTKTNVEGLPMSEGNPVIYYDTDLKGFGVVVTKASKTFVAQKDIYGRTKRVTIGRFGTWTADLARKEAQDLLILMDKGIDPVAKKREERGKEVTLREAYEIHKLYLQRKGCSPATIESYRYNVEKHLREWFNRPLQTITRSETRERHSWVTNRYGPYAANKTMKCFRAIFNTMLREHDSLGANPTMAVHWNKERRRQEPIPVANLPEWYTKVCRIQNPVRKDLQMFTLFTGLRRADVASIKWGDVNLEEGTLYRPCPKGGRDRAFTIPLPDVCVEILKRRQGDNVPWYGANCPFVFPTFDKQGHVVPVSMPYEKKLGLPTPHRLRDTYTTAANAAGLSPYDIDVLTNHRPPTGHVTAGYIRQDSEHLRVQQQKIAEYLKEKLGIKNEQTNQECATCFNP